MKKIIAIFITAALFGTACDDGFLDEKPLSFYAPENTFISTEGFETAMNGLIYLARYEITQKHTQILWGGTDMARNGRSKFAQIELLGPSTENFDASEKIWTGSYNVISCANLILANIENPDVAWRIPEDKTRIEAQAKFIRAYYYEYMTTLFGDIPFITEPVVPIRFDFTRDPVDLIQNYIINDLIESIPNLPDEVEKDGSIPKAAAQYLLTQIYLHVGKYPEAEVIAQAMISSGTHHMMKERFGTKASEPGDVFSDLFLENNQNRTSGNFETIWAIQLQYMVDGGGYSAFKRIWLPMYYAVRGMVLCDSLGGRGRGYFAPCTWLLDSYEDQDMRGSDYNVRRDFYYNNPSAKYADVYGTKVDVTEQMLVSVMFPHSKKYYFGTTADDPASSAMSKDLMIYRFAGVYLLLAEAQFKQGDHDGAAASINEVRRRANASDVLPANVDMDFILDEHAREFMTEYPPRRYTLLRTGSLAHRIEIYRPDIWPRFEVGRDELFCIPQEIIDANLDAVLEQNPGYN